jgi:two-component system CitB family sensor kinase/CitB family two-component system sensor histidine kinase CitS
MILLVGSLLVLMLGIQGAYLSQRYATLMEDQIGQRALNVARTLAANRLLIDAFGQPDPAAIIQPIAERVRVQTGASFVVVGNRDSIRYSHPLPDRLGQRMVGEDNDPALLRGEEYVSRATGSLGPSIRGKVPVWDEAGEIVGVVSVGFLASEIQDRIAGDLRSNLLLMLGTAGVGLLGAVAIANRFKRAILGLEPQEIARRLKEKEAILQSIHEGIVAVNAQGRITLANAGARRFLPSGDAEDPVGRDILEALPHSRLHEVLQTGEAQYDRETWVGEQLVVVNRVPIIVNGQVEGAVATFRSRMEILELSRSLAEVRQLADGLREQAHEFSNKLHTLAGLLQLGQVQEAIQMIGEETQLEQARLTLLQSRVRDPALCGLLAGKLMRAAARGVIIEVDEGSALQTELSAQGREALLSIVGNLIDNACEAPRPSERAPVVRLSFTDVGEDIVIEVDDNGCGVQAQQVAQVFERGTSTKGSGRGIGLALVRQLCREYGGDVTLEPGQTVGACFVAVVSKQRVALAGGAHEG